MSYQVAIKCFQENVNLIGQPGNDLQSLTLWNLNTGLANLTEALMLDIGALEQRINALEQAARRP